MIDHCESCGEPSGVYSGDYLTENACGEFVCAGCYGEAWDALAIIEHARNTGGLMVGHFITVGNTTVEVTSYSDDGRFSFDLRHR